MGGRKNLGVLEGMCGEQGGFGAEFETALRKNCF